MIVAKIGTIFLLIAIILSVYKMFGEDGPWVNGLQDGFLVACLYLYAVHHFFISQIIWVALLCFFLGTVVLIRNVNRI